LQPRTTSPNGQAVRPLRADAQRNYDLLVAAADAAFTELGADASLEEIARRAGVGIGTLYRHFPTRDTLLAKVLDDGAEAILARATELAERLTPTAALAAWLEALMGYVTTYSGLSKALAAGMAKHGCSELRGPCQAMTAAGAQLLACAQAAGELRADAEIDDVMMAVHAAVWAAEQTENPATAPRLLTMLIDGLRVEAAKRAVAPQPKRAVRRAARPAARRR
jgi:AcrR family transcriptional regulator